MSGRGAIWDIAERGTMPGTLPCHAFVPFTKRKRNRRAKGSGACPAIRARRQTRPRPLPLGVPCSSSLIARFDLWCSGLRLWLSKPPAMP